MKEQKKKLLFLVIEDDSLKRRFTKPNDVRFFSDKRTVWKKDAKREEYVVGEKTELTSGTIGIFDISDSTQVIVLLEFFEIWVTKVALRGVEKAVDQWRHG